MGEMKNIEIELSGSDTSLEIARTVYRSLFSQMDKKDIEYAITKARGNNKVAMNLALGDLIQ